MQVTFLEKQYTNTSTNLGYPLFKNNESPLIIAAKYHFIELYIEINKNKKRIFTIRTNYLTYPATQQDIIQKSLDQYTSNILIEIETQINFHNKIAEDYKKISNGLCYFI